MACDRALARLFSGWEETMIWTCLQGHMGRIVTYGGNPPTAACAQVGDFCFFAGRPARLPVERASAPILVPRDGAWAALIRRAWGGAAAPFTRYALKKDPAAFDRPWLERCAAALPPDVSLVRLGAEHCGPLLEHRWSKDLCANFHSPEDFALRGLGVGAVCGGEIVAGASSYTLYDGGIEIEIDTRPEQRGRGLATACGARLILECLDRGLYPSWDAHDRRSLALAEKLGYRLDRPYLAYLVG